jgi:Protein of unknown function (DUF3223)
MLQRAADKIGPGIQDVTVSPHLSIRGVRCFTLLRRDGTVKNFSYRKTLAAMLDDGWEDYQLPELVRLQQLVNNWKRCSHFKPDWRCLHVFSVAAVAPALASGSRACSEAGSVMLLRV